MSRWSTMGAVCPPPFGPPREYLRQDDREKRPRPCEGQPNGAEGGWDHAKQSWLRYITLGGHRLSSLYRTRSSHLTKLILSYVASIILAKTLPPEATFDTYANRTRSGQ